jgi:hypothetical protein
MELIRSAIGQLVPLIHKFGFSIFPASRCNRFAREVGSVTGVSTSSILKVT